MGKNSILYGCILFAALCLYSLSCNTVVEPPCRSQPKQQDFRKTLAAVYTAELGVRERTNNNDGIRVEQYLHYVGLSAGYEWCAAFVSWCYGEAGKPAPRNAWGPALFPAAKTTWTRAEGVKTTPLPGDVFGIWHSGKQRISHVGFVHQWAPPYLITVEGNSNHAVERRRRPTTVIYKVANWVTIP
jgi:hypothetical protein